MEILYKNIAMAIISVSIEIIAEFPWRLKKNTPWKQIIEMSCHGNYFIKNPMETLKIISMTISHGNN